MELIIKYAYIIIAMDKILASSWVDESSQIELNNEAPALISWSYIIKKVNWLVSLTKNTNDDFAEFCFSVNANIITIPSSLFLSPIPVSTIVYNNINAYISPFVDIYEEDFIKYQAQILFSVDTNATYATVHCINMDTINTHKGILTTYGKSTILESNKLECNEMEYNEMEYNEMEYNEMEYNEMEYNEMDYDSSESDESYNYYDYDEGYDSVS